MPTVAQLIADVESAREKLLHTVESLRAEQCTFKPSPDQWSVLEVIEHLYLAEISGVAKMWAALNALRAGNGWTGERPNQGRSIEEVIASTWKPREVAPPIATPHIGGPLEFWVSATRSLTPVLADLGRQLDGVDLDAVVFPHFLSGPLDARLRLEFLRYHIERHLAHIERLRIDAGFPR